MSIGVRQRSLLLNKGGLVSEDQRRLADELSVSALFDVHRAPPGQPAEECEPRAVGATRLIKLDHIDRLGSIRAADESIDTWSLTVPPQLHLHAGDVVIGIPFRERTKVAVIADKDLPAAIGTCNLAILRPRGAIDPAYMFLITSFLRSTTVTASGRRTVGLGRLSFRYLESLILPAPDAPLSASLQDLDRAGRQLEQWRGQAVDLLGSVFDVGTDIDDARRKIIEVGRVIRLRAEAAAKLDNFGSIVRTLFPHPIALRWREMEARMSANDHKAAYEAVLETAEILLCYCALVALALAREESIELGSQGAIRQKIGGSSGGPGFGDWAAVLQEIRGAKNRRGLSPEHPLHELAGVLGDDAACAARNRLSGRRNDNAHLRSVDTLDLPAAVRESFAELTTLAMRAQFLADWSLVEITSVEWDSFRHEARLRIRQFRGDHMVVPTSTMTYETSAVETGSLYLADRDHRLHLLRPFLVGRICKHCRSWSTFHIDTKKGVRQLKSLEHGHCMPCDHDPAVLRDVGLL
ncbi:hypothetical protein ACFYT3_31525 [Nocardia amikacinitolerans]|uniref:hypothetical protein n=1 Tax=Nocardia amikacinitolerans TaxID=756689 RepID=UPI0036820039